MDPISRGGGDCDKCAVNLFGNSLCVRGCGKLLGISAKRLFKFRKAWKANQPCPLDGRLSKVNAARRPSKKPYVREKIFGFLTEMYVKYSEPMPDVQSRHHGPASSRCQTDKPVRFRLRKGKRPRRAKKRDPELTEESSHQLRLLPPGSFVDYHRMFLARHPDCRASFKMFTRAAGTHVVCQCMAA